MGGEGLSLTLWQIPVGRNTRYYVIVNCRITQNVANTTPLDYIGLTVTQATLLHLLYLIQHTATQSPSEELVSFQNPAV